MSDVRHSALASGLRRSPRPPTTGLPNLIGIGVPKAGTTWLHYLLDSHPDVCMSSRKEVSYFSGNYGRGIEWYRRFFPDPDEGRDYAVIGDISPRYIYSADAARRITEVGSVDRLLLVLRNPVDRAYSDYWFRVRIDNYCGSFEQFLEHRPQSLELGFYSRYLAPFLEWFDRNDIHILLFEQLFQDIPATRQRLAGILRIDVDRFPPRAGEDPVNDRFVPKWPWLYARLVDLGRFLRRCNADQVIQWARDRGLIQAFGSGTGTKVKATMSEDTRGRLMEHYRPEIDALEQLIDQDLSLWR